MRDEELHAELARLRAENVRLNEERAVRHDENAERMNMGLARLAQHAAGEASLAAIQQRGLSIMNAGPTAGGSQAGELAIEAVAGDMKFWGLE